MKVDDFSSVPYTVEEDEIFSRITNCHCWFQIKVLVYIAQRVFGSRNPRETGKAWSLKASKVELSDLQAAQGRRENAGDEVTTVPRTPVDIHLWKRRCPHRAEAPPNHAL